MGRMGDVLAGIHSTWEFDTDSVLIRFERGIRTPKLFHVLGERRVPYEALSAVELRRGGKRGTLVLRLIPRPGADPLVEAADGQLREGSDPYRLVLPADREEAAERYAAKLSSSLGPDAKEPAIRHLVHAPAVPLNFKAYDGKASFDGEAVSFRWFWTGASSAKWKAGDQTFPISELTGVEWRSPDAVNGTGGRASNGRGDQSGGRSHGHLRLLRRGTEESADGDVLQDPASVVFGLGYGLVHESLPLAAAVLQAVHAVEPKPRSEQATSRAPRRAPADRADPADIAERIRCLGELLEAGLLTDEEFTTKKAELLAEL